MGKNADEVKIHPFFKETNFGTDLRQQKAPYVPKIEHPTDTSNFDEVDPERIRNSDQFDAFSSNTALSFHGFYGFTYRRFFTDDKTVSECNDEQGPVYVWKYERTVCSYEIPESVGMKSTWFKIQNHFLSYGIDEFIAEYGNKKNVIGNTSNKE